MQRFLALRAILFVVLLPGTVAAYVPFLLLRASGRLHVPLSSGASLLAGVLLLAGVAVLLSCVWQFFASGRGTLAPVDPPRRLVVSGLYRFTRNPMYNGVLLTLLGEAWLFRSLSLLEYAGVVLVVFHLFVVFYEEQTLRSRFGEAYDSYRGVVPRWGFTVRPYPDQQRDATPGLKLVKRSDGSTALVDDLTVAYLGSTAPQPTHEAQQDGLRWAAALQRWRAAMPECLASFPEAVSDFLTDPSRLMHALEVAFPVARDRALALFEWFGHGAGPWSGYPSYESVPEKILLALPLSPLLEALSCQELTAAQLEGAARFFAGWELETKRKQDLARLTGSDRKRLLDHVRQSGGSDADRQARAESAFAQ